MRCVRKVRLSLNLWTVPYHTLLQTLDTTTSLSPHPKKYIFNSHLSPRHIDSPFPFSTTKRLEVLTVTSAKMVWLLLVCEDVYKATEPSCVSWCQPFCLWWNGHACLWFIKFRWSKQKSGAKHLDRSSFFIFFIHLFFGWIQILWTFFSDLEPFHVSECKTNPFFFGIPNGGLNFGWKNISKIAPSNAKSS